MKKITKILLLTFFMVFGLVAMSLRSAALAGTVDPSLDLDLVYEGTNDKGEHILAVKLDAKSPNKKIKYIHISSEQRHPVYVMSTSDKPDYYQQIERLHYYVKLTMNGSGEYSNIDVVRFAIPEGQETTIHASIADKKKKALAIVESEEYKPVAPSQAPTLFYATDSYERLDVSLPELSLPRVYRDDVVVFNADTDENLGKLVNYHVQAIQPGWGHYYAGLKDVWDNTYWRYHGTKSEFRQRRLPQNIYVKFIDDNGNYYSLESNNLDLGSLPPRKPIKKYWKTGVRRPIR